MLLQIQFFIHTDTTTPYNAIQLGTDVMNITTTCKAEYIGLRIEKQGIEQCTYLGGCGIHAANGRMITSMYFELFVHFKISLCRADPL